MVPHTHVDLGWLKTVSEYYSYHTDAVGRVIGGVIEQLLLDPKRRFTWVEMKFFTIWWER